MSTVIGIGFSQASDPQEAAFMAASQAKAQLNAPQADFMLILASTHYTQPKTLDTITRTLKAKRLIGSSGGSLILPDRITQRGIAVLAINSQEINFGIASIEHINNCDLRQAGFELARRASVDLNVTPRQIGLILSHQIFQHSAPFIQGVHEAWGLGFPMIGAISSDDLKYSATCQFFQNQLLNNAAVSLLLAGDFSIACSNKHCFKPLGKPRLITKSQSNIIHTIDHKPAAHIYEHYLSNEAQMIKENFNKSHAGLYPLGIYLEKEKQYLLRNPVDILPEGSIVCQGDVPEGTEVHLMISSKDACRQSAILAAQEVNDALGGKPAKLVFIFESISRHRIQGRNAWVEMQAIKDVLGANTPMIGMYTYGEIAPFGFLDGVRQVYIHNGNILIFAIG